MRRHILHIILLFPTILCGQINSETSYYFNDEIDSLLSQLQENKFKTLDIVIKNKNARNKKEIFSYHRVNDTLLKVNAKMKEQYFHFDFTSKRYQPLDSLMRPYTFPDFYQTKKDSSGFQIYRNYDTKDHDTTLLQYIRVKRDSQDRITSHHFTNGQHQRGQEINYSYSGDSLVIINHSILETGKKVCYQKTLPQQVFVRNITIRQLNRFQKTAAKYLIQCLNIIIT